MVDSVMRELTVIRGKCMLLNYGLIDINVYIEIKLELHSVIQKNQVPKLLIRHNFLDTVIIL